jgi:hypothetical protein
VALDATLADENSLAVPKDRKFVEALHRGLDVLRAFGQKGGVLGNQQIAAITGLPKPTVITDDLHPDAAGLSGLQSTAREV